MVREGSTYYWDRRLFHLSVASIIPLLGLAVGYEYAWAMAIIGTVVLVGGEATRLLIPSVNAGFIEWLGMLLKPGGEHKVTAATYLVVTSLVMLLVFDLEIAALALLFLAFGDPLAGLVGKRFGRLRWDRWFKKGLASTSGKSAEGALAFLVGSLSIATLLWTKDVYLTLWPAAVEFLPIPLKTTLRFLSPVAWSCGCCGSVNRHNQPHTEALNAQDYTR
jgi:dolichol kinase